MTTKKPKSRLDKLSERITECKSVEIVRDFDAFLHDRVKKNGSQLVIARDADDAPMIRKQVDVRKMIDPKMKPPLDQCKAMAELAGLTWDDDAFTTGGEPNVIPVWSSDERVDRHGDIVEQSWVFDDYSSNPLILFNHAWDSIPLGSAIRNAVIQRTEADYIGPALHQLMLFGSPDNSAWSDWSSHVYNLLTLGMLRTVSVGFRPGQVLRISDPEERAKLGIGEWGVIYQKNNLIETSVTAVPANPGATTVRQLVAKGLKPGDIQVLREMRRRASPETWLDSEEALVGLAKVLFPKISWRKHKADEPIEIAEVETAEQPAEKTEQPPTDEVKAFTKMAESIEKLSASVEQLKASNDEMMTLLVELRDTIDLAAENTTVEEVDPKTEEKTDEAGKEGDKKALTSTFELILEETKKTAQRK